MSLCADGTVEKVQALPESGIRMNGGFFIFRKDIFSYIRNNEELINEPFERLIREGKLVAQHYDGFWMSMDTFKDRQLLDELYARREAPWEVWNGARGSDGQERRTVEGPYAPAMASRVAKTTALETAERLSP